MEKEKEKEKEDITSQKKEQVRRKKARLAYSEREKLLRGLGLIKVRGRFGGTYWE